MQVQYPFLYHIEGTLKNKRKQGTYLVLDYHTVDIAEISSSEEVAPVVMELPKNNIIYRYHNNILLRSGNAFDTRYSSNISFGSSEKISTEKKRNQPFMRIDDFKDVLRKMVSKDEVRHSILPPEQKVGSDYMKRTKAFYRSMPVFRYESNETVYNENDLVFKTINSSERDARIQKIEEWAAKMACIDGIMFFPSPQPYIHGNDEIIGLNYVRYERVGNPCISVLCPELIGLGFTYADSVRDTASNVTLDELKRFIKKYEGPDYILRRPDLLREPLYKYNLDVLYDAIGKIEHIKSLSINQLAALIELKKIYNDTRKKNEDGYGYKIRMLSEDEKEYVTNILSRLHDKSDGGTYVYRTNWEEYRKVEALSHQYKTTTPYEMVDGEVKPLKPLSPEHIIDSKNIIDAEYTEVPKM